MAHIRQISLPAGFRNIPPTEIDLTPGHDDVRGFQHLILTGPNGSGKSSLIEAIGRELAADSENPLGGLRDLIAPLEAELDRNDRISADIRANVAEQLERLQRVYEGNSRTRPALLSFDVSHEELSRATNEMRVFLAHLPAQRSLRPNRVSGPQKLPFLDERGLDPATSLSEYLVQFLVNKHTERAFAREDCDIEAVERIERWFARFEQHLRWLVDDEGLALRFERANFNFQIHLSDGFTFDFSTLADGYASVLSILAALHLRVEACRVAVGDPAYEPEGIVLIDEIETHLHLRLQEQILPFLTDLMPRVQFLVATHSPAVIASIPDAVVHDLGRREAVPSATSSGASATAPSSGGSAGLRR